MTRHEFIIRLNQNICLDDPRERAELDRSVTEHERNGRGFWPVVTGADGVRQVVRFVTALNAPGQRWTAETGTIDMLPLHALPVTDWPRVRLAG